MQGWPRFFADNMNRVLKLFVRYFENRNGSFVWHHVSYPLYMDIGGTVACAMSNVDGKLMHAKTVFQQILPEQSGMPPLRFRFNRQIEHYIEPHDFVAVNCLLGAKHQQNLGKTNSSESFP